MTKRIKLGIIGLSEGNGHPYSWAAICNGFDRVAIQNCPLTVIPEYLSKKTYPDEFLTDTAQVTHIWTQDKMLSKQIASSSLITNICENPEDMIGEVDAILLARDDAENHLHMATPFLVAGLPIYIDKPFALNLKDANKMLSLQKYESQIFTCSSLRYSKELLLSDIEKESLGNLLFVEASIMKNWETYAVHLIEPIVANCPKRESLKNVKVIKNKGIHQSLIQWENLTAYLKVTGNNTFPLEFSYFGSNNKITKHFSDSFDSFKNALVQFLKQVDDKRNNLISREETLEIVEIIEKGTL
jgi:hypothetical protein